jgi:hypothetical protein
VEGREDAEHGRGSPAYQVRRLHRSHPFRVIVLRHADVEELTLRTDTDEVKHILT